jgi:hypothetical protein
MARKAGIAGEPEWLPKVISAMSEGLFGSGRGTPRPERDIYVASVCESKGAFESG